MSIILIILVFTFVQRYYAQNITSSLVPLQHTTRSKNDISCVFYLMTDHEFYKGNETSYCSPLGSIYIESSSIQQGNKSYLNGPNHAKYLLELRINHVIGENYKVNEASYHKLLGSKDTTLNLFHQGNKPYLKNQYQSNALKIESHIAIEDVPQVTSKIEKNISNGIRNQTKYYEKHNHFENYNAHLTTQQLMLT
eukprot:462875_1